ncbi:ATP-dependent helicase NAM7 [Xylographa parallela]|nr:ATP-dependent helicase NAM7 [Xylographa parallela]
MQYDHEGTLVMFNIESKAEKVGPTRTKRNNVEVAATIVMVEDLISGGIAAADITLLTPYNAQVTLLKKQLALYSELPSHSDISSIHVDTVATMHGEENSVVVLTFVSTDDLGFMEESQRLCVALSRARDALIIFHNATSISMNLHRRSFRVYRDILKYLEKHDCMKEYQLRTDRIFMEDDEDTNLQREKDEYLSNKRYLTGVKALLGSVQEDLVQEDPAPRVNKGKGKEKMSSSIQSPIAAVSPREKFFDFPEPSLLDLQNYDLTPEVDEHGQPEAGPSTSVALVQNRLVVGLAKEQEEAEITREAIRLATAEEEYGRDDGKLHSCTEFLAEIPPAESDGDREEEGPSGEATENQGYSGWASGGGKGTGKERATDDSPPETKEPNWEGASDGAGMQHLYTVKT